MFACAASSAGSVAPFSTLAKLAGGGGEICFCLCQSKFKGNSIQSRQWLSRIYLVTPLDQDFRHIPVFEKGECCDRL